ncbi:glutamyl-tRNA synthetase [Suhomyces tanzawaensis NRRL Y-17324]|uniref:Glutamate--tRNA ligase, mitochondrial n=1 Tax=Suhomyces tanzawaensis NRRL Y-17324 TaxID=984487 RepID=A0A1E4SIT8_9ASCO|nr:glutamyl-tRNA synthetase [Suhomyces tanzawaensis NRRL Y-17324]ODV79425.1 glutamyl-tRNA synthetase [Suhomyces tanzawaensis NRRL Y-17324]
MTTPIFAPLRTSKTPPSIHPTTPVRTRFAPSPTGYLHLGSLRTALYNYLLARSTGGQFLLRLEDTDRTRLVPDAEQNIYDSLRWCNMTVDEGPETGGKYGPYRQSDRKDIYQHYVQILLDKGLAYRCSCSKDRLNSLRESAMKLKPPTTVTYDRKCAFDPQHSHTSDDSVIRFKSPDKYEQFDDLLHGKLDLQPQYNYNDRRYDDIVIMKSDGLPTYHFANVVDDHLMKITHVIRGEEWLPSTPKHIALYRAFGWEPPSYVHIPLLTSLGDKKLSKRQGDIGILSMKEKGILPEALVNFVALFGWSPPRETPGVSTSESMTLDQIIKSFSLDHLTKGNAKVNDSKLYFFNKHHITLAINDPQKFQELVDSNFDKFHSFSGGKYNKDYFAKVLKYLGPSLSSLDEIETLHRYIYEPVNYAELTKIPSPDFVHILDRLLHLSSTSFDENVKLLLKENPELTKKDIFQTVRFALSGGTSGLTIPLLIDLLGEQEFKERLTRATEVIIKKA